MFERSLTTRWLCALLLAAAFLPAGAGAVRGGSAATTERLVFKSDRGHGVWFAMNANGSNVRALRAPFDTAYELAWSADRSHVAYTVGTLEPLFVMRSDGTGRVKVANGAYEFAWSPNSKLLAYTDSADDRIHVVQADGKPMTSLDVGEGVEGWAGNDRLMLIDSGRHFVVDLKSGKKVLDLPDVADISEDQFQWSPSGKLLAYLSDSQDTLCLVNANGADRRCVKPALDDVSLAWSPHGDRIAVANYPQLSIVDPTTMRVRAVAKIEPYATDLTWSSDATRLAFVVGNDIGVVGADGSGLQRMRSPSGESDPRWVPASRLARFEGPRAVPIWILRVSGRTLEVQGVVGGLAAEGGQVAVLTNDTPDHFDHVVIWRPGSKDPRTFRGERWSSLALAGGLAAWIAEAGGNNTETSIGTSGRVSLGDFVSYANNTGEGDYLANLVGGGGTIAWNEWSQLANDSTVRNPSLNAWYGGRERLVRRGPDSFRVVAADGSHLLVQAKGSLVVFAVDGKILRRFPAQQHLGGASLNGRDVAVVSAGKLVDFDLATGAVKRAWKIPPKAILADVQSGVAAYVAGRSITLIDLRSGQRTTLRLKSTEAPLAQLEPAGLFYAYGTTDLSRVRLLPFADIRKRLGA